MRRFSLTMTVRPLARYRGTRYPALKARRRLGSRFRERASAWLAVHLGVLLGVVNRTQAADTAEWTIDQEGAPAGITHPIHGIYYATACYSGPVWDPANLTQRVSMETLAKNALELKNEMIQTRGVVQRPRLVPLDEPPGLCLADSSTGFELWLVPMRDERSPLGCDLLGHEVTVIGELKIVQKRFLSGFQDVALRGVWAVEVRGIKEVAEATEAAR